MWTSYYFEILDTSSTVSSTDPKCHCKMYYMLRSDKIHYLLLSFMCLFHSPSDSNILISHQNAEKLICQNKLTSCNVLQVPLLLLPLVGTPPSSTIHPKSNSTKRFKECQHYSLWWLNSLDFVQFVLPAAE